MKNAPAAVINYLNNNNVGWRGDLFTMTIIDNTTYRWTTADTGLVVGVNQFNADGTVLRRGNVRISSKLEVDQLDVDFAGPIVLGSTGKTMFQLAVQGYFDEARLQLDHLVGSDAQGAIINGPIMAWYEGRVAGIDPTPEVVRMHIKSDVELLKIMFLPKYSYMPGCGNIVYDPVCTLVKSTFTTLGAAVTGGSTTTVTTTNATIIAQAAQYYRLGVLSFTAGPLAGVRRAVKDFQVSGGVATFTLHIALKQAPTPGSDVFSVYPGCDRNQNTCNNKFANVVNFRGFPHIPAPEGGT